MKGIRRKFILICTRQYPFEIQENALKAKSAFHGRSRRNCWTCVCIMREQGVEGESGENNSERSRGVTCMGLNIYFLRKNMGVFHSVTL